MTDPSDRMVLKFRDVLAETERLRPDKLRAYQENLLVPLLLHARRNVPFYKDRLAPIFRGDDVDLAAWAKVPILTRAEAQRQAKAMTALVVPPHGGPVTSGETSGSTGRPIHFLINDLANVASLGVTDRAFRWWDFDGTKSLASFVGRNRKGAQPPDGVTVTGWRVGFPGLHHMLDMSADIDTQIDWLKRRSPHYLTAFSFTLLELAERLRVKGDDLRFERINSVGTVMTDDIRDACKQTFGVKPIDHYGAREIGLLACECPWCDNYHTNSEIALIEVLDADGNPCPPGATGRVVITSFYNYAMPFIRYEIGDFAMTGPSRSKCPVKLPTLKQIMGRYRNSFALKDGRTIMPYVPMARFREFIAFEQLQVVQTDVDQIEVRYIPLGKGRPVDEAGLQACVRALIDASFNVRAVAVDGIPRSQTGKFEDYLSLVPRRRS